MPASALQPRKELVPRFYQQKTSRTPAELASNLLEGRQPSRHGAAAARNKQTEEELQKIQLIRGLTNVNRRRWQPGDLYSPHDLSPTETQKWSKQNQGARDVFDMLGINPLHEYKNVSILNDFLTSTGRIKHRSETGLRPVNQRKIAKAIRRAVGMGLLPSVHKHPEVLENEERKRNEKRFGLDGRSGIVR